MAHSRRRLQRGRWGFFSHGDRLATVHSSIDCGSETGEHSGPADDELALDDRNRDHRTFGPMVNHLGSRGAEAALIAKKIGNGACAPYEIGCHISQLSRTRRSLTFG